MSKVEMDKNLPESHLMHQPISHYLYIIIKAETINCPSLLKNINFTSTIYTRYNTTLKNYKRFSNSSFLSSKPGLPNNANIFCLYASTPGWLNGLTPN